MIRLVILVVAMAVTSFAQSDANTIIERSVEANAADWKVAPDYDFVERDGNHVEEPRPTKSS